MQHNTAREKRIIKNRNTRSEKEQIKINVFRRKEGQQVQYQRTKTLICTFVPLPPNLILLASSLPRDATAIAPARYKEKNKLK